MRYLYKRGKNAKRRVAHLGGYDPLTGQPSLIPICGRATVQPDTTCNFPLGLRRCKHCLAKYAELVSR